MKCEFIDKGCGVCNIFYKSLKVQFLVCGICEIMSKLRRGQHTQVGNHAIIIIMFALCCPVAEDSSYSVRPGTAFKTKGAVAIGFMLFGTSYLFITAHLTAHLDKVKERIQDVKRIVRSLDLPRQLPVRHKSKGMFTYVG